MLVIGIDMNKKVQSDKLAKRLISFGLRDSILSTHPSSSPPATFNQNNSCTPVDAIWSSWSIDVTYAEYNPFDAGALSAWSDGHQLLWVEIYNCLLPQNHLPIRVLAIHTERVNSANP